MKELAMKLGLKVNYLKLAAALALILMQAGIAMGEEAKTPPAKTEAAAKTEEAAKQDAAAKPEAAAKPADATKQEAPAKPQEAAKGSPTDPVVKVNNSVITRSEVDRAMKVLGAQSQMGMNGAAKVSEDTVIDQLVSAELLYQAGEKLGVADLDKQVAAKVAEGKAKFPTEAAYENALKSADLTPKSLESLLKKDIVINNLVVKEIVPKATVTDEEVKKFYDENKDKLFKRPEQVRASHILCGVDPKATKEEKDKAKAKAEELLKEVKAGKDFAELAKANSTCPSKEKGGDLGFFSKGQMVPAFESAAFALKPGEVSNVVETQFGYHIIKLTEKKDAGVANLDEVKERIRDYLKNAKIQKGVVDYIAQLKGKAKIEKIAK
jgi:peptidyl-prolyl cis-trans isomerase C